MGIPPTPTRVALTPTPPLPTQTGAEIRAQAGAKSLDETQHTGLRPPLRDPAHLREATTRRAECAQFSARAIAAISSGESGGTLW